MEKKGLGKPLKSLTKLDTDSLLNEGSFINPESLAQKNMIDNESEEFLEFEKLLFIKNLKESLQFYKSFVGNVEIRRNEEIFTIYFKKPFMSTFITENIKNNLFYNKNRELHARLEQLIMNFDKYKREMQYLQKISRIKPIYFLIRSWRKAKDFSFLLIIFINILSLSIGYDNNSYIIQLNQIITIVQLGLGFWIFAFCVIERYPISMSKENPFKLKKVVYN